MAFFKIAGTVAAAAAAGVYCMVQNRQLRITEYNISCKGLSKAFSGKKILQLSDLHTKTYGDNYDNLINSCKASQPDYIFFTGDLYSRNEKNIAHKVVLMKRLKEIAPVYYVYGNHEADTPEKAQALSEKLEQEGVHVLRNQEVRIYIGEEYINIYGADIDRKYYKNSKGRYDNLPRLTCDVLKEMLGEPDSKHFNILLAHTPFPFKEYTKWGADLVFSGHCHGGVIRLPKVGGLLSPERSFFPKYTKGVYPCNENDKMSQMVVSTGLGKFRLQNPSEIVIVTLTSGERI